MASRKKRAPAKRVPKKAPAPALSYEDLCAIVFMHSVSPLISDAYSMEDIAGDAYDMAETMREARDGELEDDEDDEQEEQPDDYEDADGDEYEDD